jgi:adenine phosphoribosyltransferase
MNIKDIIKTVEDFPTKGVKFLDITTILENPHAFDYTVGWFSQIVTSNNIKSIIAVDARGFVWGGAVSNRTGVPLFLARKGGKLPGAVAEIRYDTEYSTSTIGLQVGRPIQGPVLIIDDIIATGGTLGAVGELLEDVWKIPAQQQIHSALVDLSFLSGKDQLLEKGYRVTNLVTY